MEAAQRDFLIICDAVYAELVPLFRAQLDLDAWLGRVPVSLEPTDRDVAYLAGLRWTRYRAAGGPRTRLLADFLIGAHASVKAGAFLTRDGGFFSRYFPELSSI